jgi:hypothetical protein
MVSFATTNPSFCCSLKLNLFFFDKKIQKYGEHAYLSRKSFGIFWNSKIKFAN